MNHFKSIIYIVAISFLSFGALKAQPNPGGGDDPENPVPITGIEYLLAAGAALGIKKFYDKKKKQ